MTSIGPVGGIWILEVVGMIKEIGESIVGARVTDPVGGLGVGTDTTAGGISIGTDAIVGAGAALGDVVIEGIAFVGFGVGRSIGVASAPGLAVGVVVESGINGAGASGLGTTTELGIVDSSFPGSRGGVGGTVSRICDATGEVDGISEPGRTGALLGF